jgi:hypothetical protein
MVVVNVSPAVDRIGKLPKSQPQVTQDHRDDRFY